MDKIPAVVRYCTIVRTDFAAGASKLFILPDWLNSLSAKQPIVSKR
jgi:hypothetical protein